MTHGKLMEKMKSVGIVGNVFNCSEDWLKDRLHRVAINGNETEWSPATSGVPQGSVRGPLHFTIHINDIHFRINNKISKSEDKIEKGKAVLSGKD